MDSRHKARPVNSPDLLQLFRFVYNTLKYILQCSLCSSYMTFMRAPENRVDEHTTDIGVDCGRMKTVLDGLTAGLPMSLSVEHPRESFASEMVRSSLRLS
jgi:hypothetical protein